MKDTRDPRGWLCWLALAAWLGPARPAAAADTDEAPYPISILFSYHLDPIGNRAPGALAMYASHREALHWATDLARRTGLKLSAGCTGPYAEACVRLGHTGDFAAFMPGGHNALGTHLHAHRKAPGDGEFQWTDAGSGNSDPAVVAEIYGDQVPFVNEIFAALGHPAESNRFLHGAHNVAPSIQDDLFLGGGALGHAYPNRFPILGAGRGLYHPFRGGWTGLDEDPSGRYVHVPIAGGIAGRDESHGPEGMVYGTLPYLKRDFLLEYLEWRHAEIHGGPRRIWVFGFGSHPYQTTEGYLGTDGTPIRETIEAFVGWLGEHFVVERSARGNAIARHATFYEVYEAFLDWEAENPGVSSIDGSPAEGPNHALPGIVERLSSSFYDGEVTIAPGTEVHRFVDRLDGTVRHVLWTEGGEGTIDLSSLSRGPLLVVDPGGSAGWTDAGRVPVGLDPVLVEGGAGESAFLRGDANADGRLDLADGIATLGFLFLGGVLDCLDAADVDDGGAIDIADPIGILAWIFAGGPAPAAPGPFACGPDPSPDAGGDLGCERFDPCAGRGSPGVTVVGGEVRISAPARATVAVPGAASGGAVESYETAFAVATGVTRWPLGPTPVLLDDGTAPAGPNEWIGYLSYVTLPKFDPSYLAGYLEALGVTEAVFRTRVNGLAEEIGVGWYRGSLFLWNPRFHPGGPEWRVFCGQLAAVEAYGAEVLVTLRDGRGDGDEAEWTRLVRDVVERLDGDGIGDDPSGATCRIWQVDNEPDLTWAGRSARDYALHYARTYEAIKAGDPGARVVLAGHSGSPRPGGGPTYAGIFRELAGLGARIEAIDQHAFGGHADYARLLRLAESQLSAAAAAGYTPEDIELWATENGTYTDVPSGGAPLPAQSEAEQAASLVKRAVLARRRGFRAFLYAFGLVEAYGATGGGAPGGYFDHTGIVYNGIGPRDGGAWVPKLAFHTYRLLSERLGPFGPASSTVEVVRDGEDGVHCYVLRRSSDGEWVAVAWRD